MSKERELLERVVLLFSPHLDANATTVGLIQEIRNHLASTKQTIPLPHGQPFADAWESWVAYRKERKQKMPASTMKMQLKKLAKLSEANAIATIERSIENGWTGLFPVDNAKPPMQTRINELEKKRQAYGY